MYFFPSFWSGGCFRLLTSLFSLFSIKSKSHSCPKLIDLPHDVLVNILMRLPTKSICCIRCASKTFSDIINSPLFAQMHTSRLLNCGMNSMSSVAVDEVPQLMLYSLPMLMGDTELPLQPLKYDGKHDLRKTDYNLHVSKILEYIYNVDFVFCNLFFFTTRVTYGGPCFLLNPLRGEVMKIPTEEIRLRNYKIQEDYYGMGYDNTANTYKIVCVSIDNSYQNYQVAARVYVLGQSSCPWRKIRAVPPAKLSEKNVCAHGDMHWFVGEESYSIGRPSHIISYDFNKEEFCWTPHPTLLSDCSSFIREYCHLLNFKGSMAIVETSATYSAMFVKIWVMKNYSKKEWSLDYEIDIQMLESSSNILGKCSCGEWENGIFFVQDDGGWFSYRPSVCYFLDLKHNSMRRVENAWSGFEKRIFGYTGSLFSLKGYSNLVQETEEHVGPNGVAASAPNGGGAPAPNGVVSAGPNGVVIAVPNGVAPPAEGSNGVVEAGEEDKRSFRGWLKGRGDKFTGILDTLIVLTVLCGVAWTLGRSIGVLCVVLGAMTGKLKQI